MSNWDSRIAERERGPQSIFEQIIAEDFLNLEKETGIQIQDIERFPPHTHTQKNNKNHSTTSTFNSETCKFLRENS